MNTAYLIPLLAVAIGGACMATQAPINARLSTHVGDPVFAAAVSVTVSTVSLGLLVVLRGHFPSLGDIVEVPWWGWIGGVLGAIFVWAAVWAVGTLGVLTFVAAAIFGQLVAALVLDSFGAFGLEVRAISWTRIAALGLVAGGLVLSRV